MWFSTSLVIDYIFAYLGLMNPLTFLFFLLAAAGAHTPLNAQYYQLHSVEGGNIRIHVEEHPHDLTVSCLHDTLLLDEYFGEYHVSELDSSFLQITYAVRGGSGFGSENTAIFAVRDGHLCKALLLTSSFLAEGFKYRQQLKTALKLIGNRSSNYVLTITSWQYLRNKSHPSGIHEKLKPVRLRFNKDSMVFYGKKVGYMDLLAR